MAKLERTPSKKTPAQKLGRPAPKPTPKMTPKEKMGAPKGGKSGCK